MFPAWLPLQTNAHQPIANQRRCHLSVVSWSECAASITVWKLESKTNEQKMLSCEPEIIPMMKPLLFEDKME